MLNIISKQYIFSIEANIFDILEKINVAFSKLLSIKKILLLSIEPIVR